VIGVVNEVLGGEATVINAAGSMPGDLLKLWRGSDPKAYHVEYGFSCMGYEIPAGLGVRLADPERDVVVFVGDGTYLMMNTEIVTAVAEGLAFTIVLVDNGGYQSIHGLQRSVGSPSFLNELRHRDPASGRTDGPTVAVDFVRHAEAMGALALEAFDLGRPARGARRGARERARGRDRGAHRPRAARPRLRGLVGRAGGRGERAVRRARRARRLRGERGAAAPPLGAPHARRRDGGRIVSAPLGFAVIGAGRIGALHARHLAGAVEGARLEVVFDVDESAARAPRSAAPRR
jgi:hypothetical protein